MRCGWRSIVFCVDRSAYSASPTTPSVRCSSNDSSFIIRPMSSSGDAISGANVSHTKRRRDTSTNSAASGSGRQVKHRHIDASRKAREDAALQKLAVITGQHVEYGKRNNLLLLEVAAARLQVLMSEARRLDQLQALSEPTTSSALDVATSPLQPPLHEAVHDSTDPLQHLALLGQCVLRQLIAADQPVSRLPMFPSLCLPLVCVAVDTARITAINQLALSVLGNTLVGTDTVGQTWQPLRQLLANTTTSHPQTSAAPTASPAESSGEECPPEQQWPTMHSVANASVPIVQPHTSMGMRAIQQLQCSSTDHNHLDVDWRLSGGDVWQTFVWLEKASHQELVVQLVRKRQHNVEAIPTSSETKADPSTLRGEQGT